MNPPDTQSNDSPRDVVVDPIRRALRAQLDEHYAHSLEYDNDTLITLVTYELACEDLDGWDLRGLVPVSVWNVMTPHQQAQIKDAGDRRWRFSVLWVGLAVMVISIIGAAAGAVGILVTTGLFLFATLPVFAQLFDSAQGWRAMMAPGTASGLKHTIRIYTEANAQLTRSKMRGALTDADDVRGAQSGDLSMIKEVPSHAD